MKRLFFALWPDDSIRQECADLMANLPQQGIKLVANRNLHVTLVFLGAVDTVIELFLIKAANELRISDIQIEFDRLSFWRKPEVLCLTGRSLDSELSQLVADLTEIARGLGIPVEDRAYQPHITLARKAKQAVDMHFKPIHWHSRGFCLVESCSLPGGVEYRILQCWG